MVPIPRSHRKLSGKIVELDMVKSQIGLFHQFRLRREDIRPGL